ncbi:MAG: (d)CMP kinase [Armatimonadota bacterium]
MPAIYERIAIIGIGLIGGSVALAARKRGLAGEIVGCARSENTRRLALDLGVADRITNDALEAAAGADLVYIATPVGLIPGLLEDLSSVVQIGCTVTDAGSVKSEICREGSRFLPASFIGGHPIAGSERSGVAAADARLFEGRTYVLTPVEADEELLERFTKFVRGLGARVQTVTPDEHDALLGLTSHLPHLWSSALALALDQSDRADELAIFTGSGLRDTTRIAASDPNLWRDIFEANKANVEHGCDLAIEAFTALREALRQDDYAKLVELLGQARDFRQTIECAAPVAASAGEAPMSACGLRLAIDGPAGAGKSSVAREVARQLGYTFIDTGAMYRAVAHFAMQQGLLPGKDDEAIGDLAGKLSYEFRSVGEQRHLFVDGQDVEAVVRLPEVGRLSSPVSAIALVRDNLLAAQRQMAAGGGVVMEGRDIGTVVLPDAEVKVFLTATPQERARRRYRQLRDMGMEVNLEDILNEQNVRDQRDSSRAVAPLKKADDAVEIISDGMGLEDVVGRIVGLVQERQSE